MVILVTDVRMVSRILIVGNCSTVSCVHNGRKAISQLHTDPNIIRTGNPWLLPRGGVERSAVSRSTGGRGIGLHRLYASSWMIFSNSRHERGRAGFCVTEERSVYSLQVEVVSDVERIPGLSSKVLLVITLCRKAALDRVVLALLSFLEVSEMIQNSWRDSLRYTTSMFVSCCVELGKKIILSSLSALKMFRASTRWTVQAFLSHQQPEYPSAWHMKWKFVGPSLPNCTQRVCCCTVLVQAT